MNLAELQSKLIAAARIHPADESVPYAFEKRIMARLAGRIAIPDPWRIWERGLARAAALCVGFVLLMAGGSVLLPSANEQTLSQDVEQTLLAAVDTPAADFTPEPQ